MKQANQTVMKQMNQTNYYETGESNKLYETGESNKIL